MDLYKQYQTDEKAELDGVWVPLSGTAKLKIARAGNPRHAACMKRLLTPYVKPGMRTTDVADEIFQAVAREAMAETILVDWDGIVKDGAPLPYSKEEALRALQMKDFQLAVWESANALETFRTARLAELEKN